MRDFTNLIGNLAPGEDNQLLRALLDQMRNDDAMETLREWAAENDLDGEEL